MEDSIAKQTVDVARPHGKRATEESWKKRPGQRNMDTGLRLRAQLEEDEGDSTKTELDGH